MEEEMEVEQKWNGMEMKWKCNIKSNLNQSGRQKIPNDFMLT